MGFRRENVGFQGNERRYPPTKIGRIAAIATLVIKT
jgi:hypothetical protein